MKTHAKNPMEKALPPKTILNSSIQRMLTRRRPAVFSVMRRAGRIGLFSFVCAAAGVSGRALGQTPAPNRNPYVWTGGSTSVQSSTPSPNTTNSNWSNGQNWNNGYPPTGNAVIQFAGSTKLNPQNDLNLIGSQAANSITFNQGAGAFTIGGNLIALTSGITNNSTNNQTLSLPIQLAGSQTWSAASGDLTFNSPVNLSGNALTTAGSHNFFFNAAITDSATGGSFIQGGTGVTTFNGMNTYAGNTTVNAGVLIINGSIASAQATVNSGGVLVENGTMGANTTVNSGGVLLGNGTINGALTNNGIVIPIDINPKDYSGAALNALPNLQSFLASGGSSISGVPLTSFNQTLTIHGSYTQSATGTLVIAYAGAAPNEHTSLNVQGPANISGTLRLVQVNGGRLSVVGQQVPIITATSVTGKFSTVVNAPLINANVVYEPTSVVLETTQGRIGPVLPPSVPPNLLAVANGIDSAAGDPRAARLFSVLDADNLNQLIKDLQHINPDTLTSTSSVGSSTSSIHMQNLQLRMQALQSGATGFSAMGFHVTDNSTGDNAAAYAGPTGPDGKGGKEVVPPPADNRWGSFITGAGDFDRVGDTSSARGFNLDSGGITLGVDFRFTDHFVAGIFAGYTYTGINIADGGRIAVDAGKAGLYATYFTGGFYVDTAVQGGYDTYETNRAGLDGTAHSSPVGGDLNVLFAPGYNWTVGGLTFGPTAKFLYAYESTNGFTETGSLAPLSVDSQHSNSLISGFGMKASYDWKIGGIIIRPELRLEWEHEYGDVATNVTSQLASGAGDPFTVTGPEIGRDSMHLGAGGAVVFSDRFSAYLYYDGEFFRTNYDSTVTGGLRLTF
jgi:autotransporter-associated beta strand protein